MSDYPPKGFEPVEYAGDSLLQHHPGYKPWTLHTKGNAVMPFVVQCPACGFRIWGGSLKIAGETWNKHIRMSKPHADPA